MPGPGVMHKLARDSKRTGRMSQESKKTGKLLVSTAFGVANRVCATEAIHLRIGVTVAAHLSVTNSS